MKQTAVEWLESIIKHCERFGTNIEKKDIEQAKEMEKEYLIDAFCNGDNSDCTSEQNSKEFAESYYNETFKKNETNSSRMVN